MRSVISCAAVIVILLAAAALRIAAARGDLWLDEIWSLQAAISAPSWTALFTQLHSDNNHHLNSVCLRLVGHTGHPLLQRGLSLTASLATLLLVWRSPLLRTPAERMIALALASFSYALVLYGSEARGYSLAMFATLAAANVAYRFTERPSSPWQWLFAVVVGIGLLSHATFAFVWLAIVAGTYRHPAARALHRVPALLTAAYFLVIVRPMDIGGGDPAPLGTVAAEFLTGIAGHALAGAAVFALIVWKEKPSPAVLAALAVPIALAARADYLHARYFFVFTPLLLLFAARALAGMSPAVTLALLVSNTVPVTKLLQHGRGHYAEACRYMSEGASIAVAADHPLRLETVAGYHGRGRIRTAEPSPRTPWLVLQSERAFDAAPVLSTATGQTYTLTRHFPSAPLSGMHWYLYRAANTTATASSYTTR